MTLYLPNTQEQDDGIGPWNDRPAVLASFELDRQARLNAHYLGVLLEHRDCGASCVNGSVGATAVSRGAW